jgi:IS30 family transposase
LSGAHPYTLSALALPQTSAQALRLLRPKRPTNRLPLNRRAPEDVQQRKRIGDWKADTIIGQNPQQAIVSLVERKSNLCLLKKVERNAAEPVEQDIEELLRPMAAKVHTITSDNGREFVNHQSVAKDLKAAFYFAYPLVAWERCTNKNTNGLVR